MAGALRTIGRCGRWLEYAARSLGEACTPICFKVALDQGLGMGQGTMGRQSWRHCLTVAMGELRSSDCVNQDFSR